MHRLRTSLVATFSIAILTSVPITASAQNGWAVFVPYVPGADAELSVSRTFVQGSNGLVETFTDEFTPGSHTLARIEARYHNCRASADNVNFTITAGHWTEVDVPMQFRDCSMPINMAALGIHLADGVGTVLYAGSSSSGPSPEVASCTLFEVNGPQYYAWGNFHGCQGDAPYGDSIVVTLTPAVGSIYPHVEYVIADTASLWYNTGWGFADTTNPHPNGISAKTDIGVTLVGGSAQGYVSNSIFRIVNHGLVNATSVHVETTLAVGENDDAQALMSIQDGYCTRNLTCDLSSLPAGDSTTVTVRIETIPDNLADPGQLEIVTCTGATVSIGDGPPDDGPADLNTSNNHAPCVTTTVPVTVAIGGATPPSHTVAAGSSNVPMIEFLLTPASQQTVTSVTVQASGTGNEQTDVTAVNLYVDKNSNGSVDANDSLVATGSFAANDGTATLAVNPGLAITAPTALLVTYSFSVTVAARLGGAIVLAFLPLFLIPATRKRKTVLAMLLVMITSVAIVSCGGDSTGPKQNNGSVTFKSTLTGVTTTTGTVSDLTVSGATITVNK
ncbi:MAG TPA: hypothetical protein VGO46_17520 [Gemmatimonadaceae bacterium]|jgi:hypothetical protein|nr:hypothetical protein [Gemmatimonadaceae bacterium]